MISAAAIQADNGVFAANRAVGTVALAVKSARGATRRARVVEEGSLRVRFPGARSHDCEAVVVNTAGGVAGGDRLALHVEVEENARLAVTSAAAEKIYRSLGPEAVIDLRLAVGREAKLHWLPQETILFDRARLRRTIEVDLAEGATLILAEALVFGRAAMGEVVDHGSVFDRWRVRRGGKLLFAETVRIEGGVAASLKKRAVAASGRAVATVLMVPGDAAMVAALRAPAHFHGETAASAWNGFAVARFLAGDGAALRHDIIAALTALGVALPRLWLN